MTSNPSLSANASAEGCGGLGSGIPSRATAARRPFRPHELLARAFIHRAPHLVAPYGALPASNSVTSNPSLSANTSVEGCGGLGSGIPSRATALRRPFRPHELLARAFIHRAPHLVAPYGALPASNSVTSNPSLSANKEAAFRRLQLAESEGFEPSVSF